MDYRTPNCVFRIGIKEVDLFNRGQGGKCRLVGNYSELIAHVLFKQTKNKMNNGELYVPTKAGCSSEG